MKKTKALHFLTAFIFLVMGASFVFIRSMPASAAGAGEDPWTHHVYWISVSISGLPSSYSATVYLDGYRWGTYRGGLTLEFYFYRGTTHSISVDQVVNTSARETYYCSSNNWAFSSGGASQYYPRNFEFNYILRSI
jgi:hypothetical protein